MTLFEINKAIEDLMTYDPETGEVTADAEALEKLEMDRAEKIENIACFIKNLKAEETAIKEEAKKMTARAKTAGNKAEWLKDYLFNMLNGERFSSPKAVVSYKKSQAVECVLDEEQIKSLPEQFLRIKTELDKTAIKDALKAGEEVVGCKLVENTSMTIK